MSTKMVFVYTKAHKLWPTHTHNCSTLFETSREVLQELSLLQKIHKFNKTPI